MNHVNHMKNGGSKMERGAGMRAHPEEGRGGLGRW